MNVKTYSRSKDGSTKITANLMVAEFARYDNAALAAKHCGDEVKIDLDLAESLQKIREHFGRELIITSGYRPEGYNAGIGGEKNSYHVFGQAADFYVKGIEPAEVAKFAESIGVRGIGLYTAQKFVHIDTRGAKYYWRNDGRGNYAVSTHGGAPVSDNPCAVWEVYVKAVQKAVGVVQDGIAGPKTMAKCPVLKLGSRHAVLIPVQNRLNFIGHDCGAADGVFGAKTLAGVKDFQRANGLIVDGIIGAKTWRKLV